MLRKAPLSVRVRREKVGLQIQQPASDRGTIGGQSDRRRAVDAATGGDAAGRILSEAEVVERIAKCQQYAVSLLPNAIKVIADATHSDNPRLRLLAAIKLWEVSGLSRRGGIEQVLETTAAADQKAKKQRWVFQGQMMDMMLNKSEKYEMPLAQGFTEQVREVAKRVEELARKLGTESADSGAESDPFQG